MGFTSLLLALNCLTMSLAPAFEAAAGRGEASKVGKKLRNLLLSRDRGMTEIFDLAVLQSCLKSYGDEIWMNPSALIP